MARGLVNPVGHRGLVDDASPGAGGGGIGTITSDDDTVAITNPSGPTTNLSVPGGAATADEILLALLQYGAGNAQVPDQGLPIDIEAATEFYISTETDNDHAIHDVPVLFPVHRPLRGLRLVGWFDLLYMPSTDMENCTLTLHVDVWDGEEIISTLTHDLTGTTFQQEYFDVETEIVLAAGQAVGLRAVFSENLDDGSTMRGSFRIMGLADNDVGPYVGDHLTLHLETIDDFATPITVEDGRATVVPNRASSGAPLDAIEMTEPGSQPAPLYTTGLLNGRAGLQFAMTDGSHGNVLGCRDYPVTLFSPNADATHYGPRTTFTLMRMTATDPFAQATAAWHNAAGPSASSQLGTMVERVPIYAAGVDPKASVYETTSQTFDVRTCYPDPLTTELGNVVLLEEQIDAAGVLHVRINGLELELDETDPNPPAPGVVPTLSWYAIGARSNGSDPMIGDYFARMVYAESLTAGQAAKTRNYLLRRFGLDT